MKPDRASRTAEHNAGLDRRCDVGGAEYRGRYFGELARTMVGDESYCVAVVGVQAH
jgi:hypothetical protein